MHCIIVQNSAFQLGTAFVPAFRDTRRAEQTCEFPAKRRGHRVIVAWYFKTSQLACAPSCLSPIQWPREGDTGKRESERRRTGEDLESSRKSEKEGEGIEKETERREGGVTYLLVHGRHEANLKTDFRPVLCVYLRWARYGRACAERLVCVLCANFDYCAGRTRVRHVERSSRSNDRFEKRSRNRSGEEGDWFLPDLCCCEMCSCGVTELRVNVDNKWVWDFRWFPC